MKLFPIFLCLLFLVACSNKNVIINSNPVAKITEKEVYFENGKKMQLPINKPTNTIIFLIRHAEKAKEGGKDPLLTKEGQARAEKLKSLLLKAGIDAIYSTDYQRTMLTVGPLSSYLNQDIQSYNPKKLDNLAEQLLEKHKGEQILVVGHSNSTPMLVNALIGKEKFPMIEESEYGHLFRVLINEKGKKKVMDLWY